MGTKLISYFSTNSVGRQHVLSVITATFLTCALPIKIKPAVGLEPTTGGLRNRCSATELRWRVYTRGIIPESGERGQMVCYKSSQRRVVGQKVSSESGKPPLFWDRGHYELSFPSFLRRSCRAWIFFSIQYPTLPVSSIVKPMPPTDAINIIHLPIMSIP